MKNALNKFISSLDFLFGLVGIVMILIATYAVFARNILIVSTPWSDELLKLLFVWSIYIGSAILFMNDGLISLTLIEDKYKESKPVVYGTLKAIQYLAGIGICGLITSQMVTIVGTQMRTGEATTVLKYPLWIMNTGNPAWPGTDRASRTCETGRIKRIFCDKKIGGFCYERIY